MFGQDQEIFNVLLGAISEGVLIVDMHQNIMEANSALASVFGYQNKELVGQPLDLLIPHRYHSSHKGHFNSFMGEGDRKQMSEGRCVYGVRKDGTNFPVEIGLNPFKIYGKTYVMAIVVDISERKQQEIQIVELNARLEEKVASRTKALNEALNALKITNKELADENTKRIEAEEETRKALLKEIELNDLKTKFLSLVSHEFKTPLSGILTSAMLLGKYKLTEQQEKRDKHLKIITDKVHYLNNILNDFLSVEKLETGKVNYNFYEFKLSKIVNEVVYNCNMLLKEGQQIKYPENVDEISLFQDEKILELALSNLVQNAIKYSPENTIIDLKVKQKAGVTSFTIKDQGIGIPEKDQKNIFNRYFRAGNVLHTQGTGIGLNIVKSHLENLGGTIVFKSEEGKGSTFTLTLPNKAVIL
ncbi:PAS domain-containing sensor histidine kinase [Jejuia pallidilutea]|uniref:histidine kinase n=1 Tax=Jejuia pallidilutea TaxID=504487 RepID=A0A090WAN2_9FLAO|nr:PAS domain-containing sensor histidine kinase [Jejuia pallidilutea]GAL72479.1 sensory transduction histidine kinase [Jejuia pallidilutea]GAL88552.1 sensory transduction histidine kinase [Jejuia pallidilutea]